MLSAGCQGGYADMEDMEKTWKIKIDMEDMENYGWTWKKIGLDFISLITFCHTKKPRKF